MNHPLPFCQSSNDDADDHDDDAADESRQDAPTHYDGEQSTCSWDELLYQMTKGALGLKPKRGTPPTDATETQRKENQSGR